MKREEIKNPPVLVPVPTGNLDKKGTVEKGFLDVVTKSINVTLEDLGRPQKWMKALFRKIENSYLCKMECVAITPPIIRPKNGDIDCDQFIITAVAVDVSAVFKKEGL